MLDQIKALFETRPIWTRGAVLEKNWILIDWYVKYLLPAVSFTVGHGLGKTAG
jgi:hypothetical protein